LLHLKENWEIPLCVRKKKSLNSCTAATQFQQRTGHPRRFTTRDPIGIWGDEINLGGGYAYCGNNPVNRWDPLGLEECPDEEEPGLSGLEPGYIRLGVVPGELTTVVDIPIPEDSGSSIDDFQTVVDMAGFIPGAGDLLDLGNAGLFTLRGKFGDALLSLVGAIPVVGSFVSKGLKYGEKILFKSEHAASHMLKAGLDAAKVESKIASSIGRAVSNATSVGGDFWGKVMVDGKSVLFRAKVLPTGEINVGTYYVPTPK